MRDVAEIAYFHDPYPCIDYEYEIAKKIYEERHIGDKLSDD